MKLDEITFKEISRERTGNILLNYHYLQRMPPLTIAFGAFHEGKLIGVITYGKPPSNSLCVGVAGDKYSENVFELNRLYTLDETPKNLESKFLAFTLSELKRMEKEWLIVSYADKGMGHSGYIYQATNWLYTGHSASRTDVYVGKGGHSRTYTEQQRDFVVRKKRSVKHRYLYIVGDKRFKRNVVESINYEIINEYPKGEPSHYSKGDGIENLLYHKITREEFYESDFLENPKKYLTDSEYTLYKELYEYDEQLSFL